MEEVDVGEEKCRTVISGLVKFVPEDQMQDRCFFFFFVWRKTANDPVYRTTRFYLKTVQRKIKMYLGVYLHFICHSMHF